MHLLVVEPDILVSDDIVSILGKHLRPNEVTRRASLVEAVGDIEVLQADDLLVVSTTREDLRGDGLLSRMNELPFSLLLLNTDSNAEPQDQDPWHRISKPFSESMLIRAAEQAMSKRRREAG